MRKQLDMFFNTTNEVGEMLADRKIKTSKQNAEILAFFTLYHYHTFTPADVHHHLTTMGKVYPLTSVRRGINTLTNENFLYKTTEKRSGMYGVPNYCWKFKSTNPLN